MIIKREDLEGQELELLAPYSVRSAESKGRSYSEKEDPYRTCFQRDRDRIIHCKAFRRLNGKTQVFIAGYGDHYRSRLTHSMEVAQFGRDVARMLNLNQDLAEAIGLAHDLGHTPFGHAGQEALNEVMETFGTHFEHNEQSFRVVHELERKSDKYKGLNLSFEVLDGLLKHRTRYDRPAAFDHLMPSLEAQIVNIADEIAYQSHDIDDGLRSGILSDKVLMKLEICKRATAEKRLSGDSKIRQHQIVTSIMALLVNDLAGNTNRKLKKLGIRTVADIYAHDGQVALFSDEVNHMAVQLKDYLFNHFYNAREVMKYNEEGKNVITGLFRTLYENPEKLPEKYQAQLENEERYVVIKDYVAGMTDSFAMDLYNKLVK
ncbi:deoxyguanosinetriphosphate triphosphohydrolase [Patescibacteria group bacterium]|nr:deoxyguanosinetriphosphate triphosphohydrolase [Patescibacteria group bacterium]MBU1016462.1 deoxyguanosinetriphosphate triphosphohydrolase [Patescibacteria group bacterium]MBU1684960.1 deoxyguanosinetriphosphate triphosphohydrolase [Patescibacteria group bacterium]MBU1939012.1 deoxyguanosinetriphosphate triphosphohydrolase [Patescibacteria group bacterium]